MPQCFHCHSPFPITADDHIFLQKLQVPEPTLCPRCRQQQRLAWRNERRMYKRKCDFSGKDIISMYPPDSPFEIYDTPIWWSDQWDALEYGRDFDFTRPFFEQFRELQLAVPRAALVNKQSENSAYTNHAGKNKNCYLSGCIFGSEGCYYSDWIVDSRDAIDCSYLVSHDEGCYETYYAWNSQQTFFCDFIRQCSNLWFCYDCVNAHDCFMCWNLRNKRYCIRNQQFTKENYEQKMKNLLPLTADALRAFRQEYIDVKNHIALRPATYTVNTENSIGDLLFEAKNTYYGFDSIKTEDCRYVFDAIDVKDSMDLYHVGWAELMYQCHAISNGYFCRFCHFTYDNSFATYCDCTQNCRNVFGCVGLVRQEYCILNKKYTKEAYEALVPKIIEHMKKTRLPDGRIEWGEFFPMTFSPFAYNQSRVQEYFPLTQTEVEGKGWRWSSYTPPVPVVAKCGKGGAHFAGATCVAIACESTGRWFGVVKGELNFYRKNGLPLPHRHPDQRYLDRIAQRVPRALWQRACPRCQKATWTSSSPESGANWACRECYLEEIR